MNKLFLSFLVCLPTLVWGVEIIDRDLERSMENFNGRRLADWMNRSDLPHGMLDSLSPYIDKLEYKNRPLMDRATVIKPSFHGDFRASQDLLYRFFNYKPLSANINPLHTLILSGCAELNDDHIEAMCCNPFFYRLKNINLSRTGVTYRGLQSILQSKIGSIRGMPQISTKLSNNVSIVNIVITSDRVDQEISKTYRKFNFRIDYTCPGTGENRFHSSKQAVKELKLIIKPTFDPASNFINNKINIEDPDSFFSCSQSHENSFYEQSKLDLSSLFDYKDKIVDYIKCMCNNPFFHKLEEIIIPLDFDHSKLEHVVKTIVDSKIGSVRRGPPILSVDPREGSISRVKVVIIGERPESYNYKDKLIQPRFNIRYVQIHNKPSHMFKPDANGKKIVEVEFRS
jgi:hypothetical protein